jgi:hypothetical protein
MLREPPPLSASLEREVPHRSACATTPQDRHANQAWETRFALSMCPHSAQVREVYAGSTCTTGTPALRALYAMNCPSWAKDQLEWVARWGFLSCTRSRMPVRSSRAIPRPVRSASATTYFAILWLMSFARRASLRRRFFSRRLADGVFFFWSLVRRPRSRIRIRIRLSSRPDMISPSEVVAMFTMPRSMPRKSAGSVFGSASGTSQVAFSNHMPSRCTRSDSPSRYSASVAGCWGDAVKATFFIRPPVVRTDTVRPAICHESIRSS